MNLSNLFGNKDKNTLDPYWEFNQQEHFRPKLNKGDFFKLNGYDFGWFVLEPLSKSIKKGEKEVEKTMTFSYAQKALYYWWYLDGQVTNGGFVQFYYNGYENYIPTIIKGLEYIGDAKMASLIKKADKIYQKNKKLVNKAQESDLFGSDLYERLDELSLLDDKYYQLNKNTMSLIENYFRKNPNEVAIDEEGKEFDSTFTGICKTYYDDKTTKDEFYLEKGLIHGEFKSFYQNGNLKEKIQYSKGKKTRECQEFYENGNLKYQVTKDTAQKILLHKWYYENGNPKKLESKLIDKNEMFGKYKEWYENGQLAESGIYKSAYEREGEWLEFYQDGSKKVEAEFINGNFKLKNHWNEKGEQILINGTGVYLREHSMYGDEVERDEDEYKDYKRHGKQKTFLNGILTRYQEMKEGKKHGITRNYYKNGNIKEESIYENGNEISKKEFPIFENPIVITTIICEMKDEWLINDELETADTYPIPLNHNDLSRRFDVDIDIFEGYPQDYDLSYNYFVSIDKEGNVIKVDFLSGSNGFLIERIQKNIEDLHFIPAKKDEQAVESYTVVKYKLNLGE